MRPRPSRSRASRSLAVPFVAATILSLGGPARADDDAGGVTWSKDVAPLVFAKCAECHRAGQLGPMSLLSYADARPWAKSIRKAVTSREMPPWQAASPHGTFSNDISLTDAEIATLVSWVDSGAPEGDPALAPPAPSFAEGWRHGTPDHVIELDEVEVPADGPDLFPNLTAEVELPEKRWIRAVEVQAGDPSVLHHVVVFRGGAMRGLPVADVAATEEGTERRASRGMGGGGAAAIGGGPLAVWAVGSPPNVYPDGIGQQVPKKFTVTANMHYHPSGQVARDRTRIGLYFGEGEMEKVVSAQAVGNLDVRIPPGASDFRLEGEVKIRQDIRVVSLFPHMHMRGRRMVYTAKLPDGGERTLLDVPRYDFDWQWFYYPAEPMILPEGTVLHVSAEYDNSAANPNNPDPNAWVYFGEESDDDMMFGMFEYVPVEGMVARPAPIKEVMDEAIAKLPADRTWRVQLKTGIMAVPVLVYLPLEGRGQLHFPFGGQTLAMPLSEVEWGADGSFETTLDIFGGRTSAGLKGTVDAEGTIRGEFDMKGMEEFGGNNIQFESFEGVRADRTEG